MIGEKNLAAQDPICPIDRAEVRITRSALLEGRFENVYPFAKSRANTVIDRSETKILRIRDFKSAEVNFFNRGVVSRVHRRRQWVNRVVPNNCRIHQQHVFYCARHRSQHTESRVTEAMLLVWDNSRCAAVRDNAIKGRWDAKAAA